MVHSRKATNQFDREIMANVKHVYYFFIKPKHITISFHSIIACDSLNKMIKPLGIYYYDLFKSIS